jgi:hypothetical protein
MSGPFGGGLERRASAHDALGLAAGILVASACVAAREDGHRRFGGIGMAGRSAFGTQAP